VTVNTRHTQVERRRTASEDRREMTETLFLRRSRADDPAERAQVEEDIVHLNLRMATDAARRFRDRGIADDDLRQVAHLGLVKAVQGFDPGRGHDFLSYAVPTIRGEVRRYFRDHGWAVRPTRSVQETQAKINACEFELYQRLGRGPRPSELAEHLGLDVDLVVEALGANGCFAPVSLDLPVRGESGASIGETLEQVDDEFDRAEARAMLDPVLAELGARDRLIVELRFFEGMTQAEVGARIGVTQMQVSRLLARILGQLRTALEPSAA
jgi:RNA polymerase sigma-B factor